MIEILEVGDEVLVKGKERMREGALSMALGMGGCGIVTCKLFWIGCVCRKA